MVQSISVKITFTPVFSEPEHENTVNTNKRITVRYSINLLSTPVFERRRERLLISDVTASQ